MLWQRSAASSVLLTSRTFHGTRPEEARTWCTPDEKVVSGKAADMDQRAPDVVLLGPEWPERALLRAQLIEEGYDVVAIDAWPIPRLYRRPGMKPRVLIIDLQGLPDLRETLGEVPFVMPPERVLVVTSLGTLTGEEIRRLGFAAIERPATIGQIVAGAAALLSGEPTQSTRSTVPSTPKR